MGFGLAAKFGDEFEAEFEGGAGAAGGEELAVFDDAFIGEDAGEIGVDGKVRGEAFAGEESGIEQNHGGGTNGGDDFALGGVGLREAGGATVFAEDFYAGTAGEEEGIEGLGMGFRFGEGGVGLGDDAAAASEEAVAGDGGEDDFGVGAAEEVNGGDGFNFFKAGGEEAEDAFFHEEEGSS